MKIRIIPLVLALSSFIFSLGCMSSFLERSLADYLVIEDGREWIFLENESDTVLRSVIGDTVIQSDTAKAVSFGGEINIYKLLHQKVEMWSKYVDYYWGREVLLEERFTLLYETPFVKGNRWSESYTTEKIVLGDTFHLVHDVEGEVFFLGEIKVPAGSFYDVYGVTVKNIYSGVTPHGEISQTTVDTFYFAPDVGLIKRVRNEGGVISKYELLQY